MNVCLKKIIFSSLRQFDLFCQVFSKIFSKFHFKFGKRIEIEQKLL